MQSLFLEVIFFEVFFGQVQENLGKTLRTAKNLAVPTPMGYDSLLVHHAYCTNVTKTLLFAC